MSPRISSLLILLLLSGALAACGGSVAPPGVLRLPLPHLNAPPDPALGDSPSDLFVDSLLYSGLMKFGPDMHVIPDLAVSIPTISPDGRTYTFTIRHDARFADGTHVVARDVVYSLHRALHLDSRAARFALGDIAGASRVERGATSLAGAQVLDRLTLRIRLSHPDADFLQRLSLPPAFVVNRRVVGLSSIHGWPDALDGTGPFRYASRAGDEITLLPRPHEYEGSAALRSLVLVAAPGDRLTLYKRGDIDAVRLAPTDASMSTHPDFHQSPGLTTYDAVAAGDVAVARLDRSSLVGGTLLLPLPSIVPPAVPDYVGSAAVPPTSRDAHIFLSGGHRAPLSILRRRLRAQWHTVHGPSVHLRLAAFSSILPDPSAWLDRVPTTNAWYRWSLHHAAGLTDDPVTRMDIYSRLETWALRRGLVIPLASGTQDYLIKGSVQGLQVTPLGLMPQNNDWASVSVT